MSNSKLQTVFWEAHYLNKTPLREVDGALYSKLDRENMIGFSLTMLGVGNVFNFSFPPHIQGKNLIYRRRSAIIGDETKTIYIIGFWPIGPAFSIDLDYNSYRVLEHGFDNNDADLFMPVPFEFETFFYNEYHKMIGA